MEEIEIFKGKKIFQIFLKICVVAAKTGITVNIFE
jgi:hypothetical protein